MLESIVAIAIVVVVGAAFLAYRHRSERGIESGISSFRRELKALAPRRDGERPPSTDRTGEDLAAGRSTGVGIVRPEPSDADEAPDDGAGEAAADDTDSD